MIAAEYGITKKAACKVVTQACSELISSNDLTALLQPQGYCGVLLVDGKWVKVKEGDRRCYVEITFMDYETHDIPVHLFAESENMEVIEEGFHLLKELGYPLKAVVCDESMGEIAQVAKKVFPDIVIQLCLLHYFKNIEREFKVNHILRSLKSLQRKLDYLGNSPLLPSRPHSVRKAVQIINRQAKLEAEYWPLIVLQKIFLKIFWSTDVLEKIDELEDEMNELLARSIAQNYVHVQKMVKRYKDYYEKRDELLAFTRSEILIPQTTNLIEGYHSTSLQIRLSSIRGFEKIENAEKYLNALVLKRRFKKFTDCRKPFTDLNGFSPIQIAQPEHLLGHDFIKNNWIFFCRNIKQNSPS